MDNKIDKVKKEANSASLKIAIIMQELQSSNSSFNFYIDYKDAVYEEFNNGKRLMTLLPEINIKSIVK